MNDIDIKIETIEIKDPGSRKINMKFHVMTEEEILAEGSEENCLKRHNEREATDIADSYITNYTKPFNKDTKGHCWTVIPVLQQLWGTPWNNAAVNFIHTLRPSGIRVSTGSITADASTWRVTVFLDKDERTIKRIDQEVEVGCNGFRNGSDATAYLKGNEDQLNSCSGLGIVNPRGLAAGLKDIKVGI